MVNGEWTMGNGEWSIVNRQSYLIWDWILFAWIFAFTESSFI